MKRLLALPILIIALFMCGCSMQPPTYHALKPVSYGDDAPYAAILDDDGERVVRFRISDDSLDEGYVELPEDEVDVAYVGRGVSPYALEYEGKWRIYVHECDDWTDAPYGPAVTMV